MATLEGNPTGPRSSLPGRRAAYFALKLLAAAALMWWLLSQDRLDLGLLGRLEADGRTSALLAAGAACTLCGLLLTGWRFKLLLAASGFQLSFSRAFGLTLVGSLFSCALPGLVGGDAVKIAYLCGNVSERRVDAVAAVVMDRLLGLYSLLVLATLVLAAAWAAGFIPPGLGILAAVPLALAASSAFTLLAARGAASARDAAQRGSLVPRTLRQFAAASRYYLRLPRLMAVAVAISVLNHAFLVGVYVSAALLLRDSLPLLSQLVIDPAAMVMNAVALTPGGLGITEGAFSLLFEAAGSPSGATVGLMGRLIQYGVFAAAGSIALSALRLRRPIPVAAKRPPVARETAAP